MDAPLTLDDLVRACRVERAALVEWIELGVVRPAGPSPEGPPADWRFDEPGLHRVRRVARLAREFDLAPFAAALVDDLLRERAMLERRVRLLERLLDDG